MNSSLIETKLTKLPRPVRNKPIFTPRIMHFGPGAFFRSFVASLIDEVNEKSVEKWGIIAVSLNSESTFDKLAPQEFVFNSLAMSSLAKVVQKISSISDFWVAHKDSQVVLDALSDEKIEIVSLTITEKGYCHEPSSGALDRAHADIIHDVDHGLPKSAVGFLVRALQMRRAAGVAPFTVLCCDVLPQNGQLVRSVVLELARLINPELADWIAQNGLFPSTMVDRIVPATTPEDIATLADKSGYLDRSPVIHEPFRQWVIEDNFVNGERPDFAAAGAQMVDDVTAFERMKLRCLNGTHSSLAYLGYLAGHETIFDTV